MLLSIARSLGGSARLECPCGRAALKASAIGFGGDALQRTSALFVSLVRHSALYLSVIGARLYLRDIGGQCMSDPEDDLLRSSF